MMFSSGIMKIKGFNHQNRSWVFCLLASLIFTCFAASSEAKAQELEQVVNGTPAKTQKSNLRSNKKKATPAPKQSQNSTAKSTARRNRGGNKVEITKVEERQQVVFNTGAPKVEILVDGKTIGFSDKDAKLPAWLSKGEHQVVARKYGVDLLPSTPLIVTEELKNVDFAAQIAKAIDAFRESKILEGDKTTEKKTIDVVALLNTYRDPNKTGEVTTQDWQTVYEQTRQRMMVGNTENDVEALFSFAQGQIELAMGNKPKAVNLFSAATVFLPDSPMMHYGLGKAYFEMGNITESAGSFTKTIQLDNKYTLAYKGLGDIYLKQNKTKEAATYYQQAQRLGMTTPEIRLRIAETYIRNKNCAGALKELEVLRTEAPSANVMMALSDCYLEEERAVSAIEALEEAIKLEPNSAIVHYKIGLIYLKQKEYGKAKESLERALALDTENKINRKELQEQIKKAQKNASKS